MTHNSTATSDLENTSSDFPDPSADVDPSDAGWANLARASAELQGRTELRAVEVANDVLRLALQSSRRSLPLRARPPQDYVRISDRVLIRRLQEAIDAVSPTLAVGQVLLRVRPDGVLEQLTLELLVQYGQVILDVADRVRLIVSQVVAELLGLEKAGVHVVTSSAAADPPRRPAVVTHVHVSDVTVGSPRLVDPTDEQQ